jgi:hypothetical protein
MAVWLASFAGHTIDWRGEKFSLQGGKLKRIDANPLPNIEHRDHKTTS